MEFLYTKQVIALTLALLVGLSLCMVAQGQEAGSVAGLWEQATIYRDEWGTPHVYANDPRALAFAFGYAQAADHLEAMARAYRIANGRAAEVFGEPYAQSDEFALKMGHAALAHEAFPRLDPLSRDLCEGFALGANAWIVEHPDRVPPWADGVKPEDVLALLHCYLMSFAPFDLPGVFHRGPAATSGNAWAVSGEHSESGEALLAINPHTAYDSPFQWYEAHLACQDLNMAGATLFGLPVILQGHNDVLGWALTPNQADFADIYLEAAPGDDGTSGRGKDRMFPGGEALIDAYLLGSSRPYVVSTPNGPVQRSVPCAVMPRGPLVGIQNGELCVYQIGGYRDFGALTQFYEMGRARDLGSFQAALAMRQLPCFHVVYADREGNIFYLYDVKAGNKPITDEKPKLPKKGKEPSLEDRVPPRVIDWTTPVPGNDFIFEWREIIPIEALPAVVNPASGYVQACGNPPWDATEDSGLKPEAFPAWFARDRDTFRAQRVRRLLGLGKRSFRDCQSMLYDVVAPFAMDVVPKLLDAAQRRADFVANAHPDVPAGLDALKTWNFIADTRSTAMPFFHLWWTALRGQEPQAFKNDDALYAALQENSDATQELALNAASEAAKMMRNDFQSVSVPWGGVHTVVRGAREVPIGGACTGEPVFTASDYVYEGRKWRVTYGYAFAMVVSFGEKPSAVSMTPFGASEDPKSPHYADQLDLMAEGRFKVTRFRTEDVQRNATSGRGCAVALRPKGMEGLFTLRTATPIEARLNSSVESPGALPANLVPFTLFVEIERVPRATPVSAQIELPVPAVLCARENLDKLAVHAFRGDRWDRLPAQQLDAETRTFSSQDDEGPATYAVLGPSLYRASRLTIPGENEPSPPPAKPAPVIEPKPFEPEPADQPKSIEPAPPEKPEASKPEVEAEEPAPKTGETAAKEPIAEKASSAPEDDSGNKRKTMRITGAPKPSSSTPPATDDSEKTGASSPNSEAKPKGRVMWGVPKGMVTTPSATPNAEEAAGKDVPALPADSTPAASPDSDAPKRKIMHITGAPNAPPSTHPATTRSEEAAPVTQDTAGPKQKGKVTWGVPERPPSTPLVLPNKSEEPPPAQELPELDVSPLREYLDAEKDKLAKPKGSSTKTEAKPKSKTKSKERPDKKKPAKKKLNPSAVPAASNGDAASRNGKPPAS